MKYTLLIKNEPMTLGCGDVLASIDSSRNYHQKYNCRHPLAVYNVSIKKVLSRIDRCLRICLEMSRLEGIEKLPHQLNADLIETIESTFYASAEHVDDVNLIAKTFFSDVDSKLKNRALDKFKLALKPVRDTISALANNLKHAHGRLRLFSCNFLVENRISVLTGFYAEAFYNDGVGPNPIFHPKKGTVVSLSTHLWEQVIFLWEVSDLLKKFVMEFGELRTETELKSDSDKYVEVVDLLLSLPVYSFDAPHPFTYHNVSVLRLPRPSNPLVDVAGSVYLPWNSFNLLTASTGSFTHSYEGDGVTKKFHIVNPPKIQLVHWKAPN